MVQTPIYMGLITERVSKSADFDTRYRRVRVNAVLAEIFEGQVAVLGTVPFGVHQVVARYLYIHLFGFLGLHHLDELGGTSGPKLVGTDLRLRKHNASGCYQCAFADFGVIHNDRAHADKGVIMDLRAVDNHVVADRNVVADLDRRFLIESVEDRTVLDIDAVADTDRVYVAAKDSAEPDGTFRSDNDVTDDHRVGSQETVLSYFGDKAPYFLNYWHPEYYRLSGSVFFSSHAASSEVRSGVRRERTLA